MTGRGLKHRFVLGEYRRLGPGGRDQYRPIGQPEVRQAQELPDKFPISAGAEEEEGGRMPPSIGLRSRSADPDRHQLDPLFLRLNPQPTLLHGFRWVAVGFSFNLDSLYLLPKIFIH